MYGVDEDKSRSEHTEERETLNRRERQTDTREKGISGESA